METSTHQDPALEVSTSVVACRFEGLESRMKPQDWEGIFSISVNLDMKWYQFTLICIYIYITNTDLVIWCGVHCGVILSKTDDDFNRDNSGLRTLGQHPHPCRHEQALLLEHWCSEWWTFTVYSAGTEPRYCSNFICPSKCIDITMATWWKEIW